MLPVARQSAPLPTDAQVGDFARLRDQQIANAAAARSRRCFCCSFCSWVCSANLLSISVYSHSTTYNRSTPKICRRDFWYRSPVRCFRYRRNRDEQHRCASRCSFRCFWYQRQTDAFRSKTPMALLVSDRRLDTFGLERPALLVSNLTQRCFSTAIASLSGFDHHDGTKRQRMRSSVRAVLNAAPCLPAL
jgi:hypothetical protein